MGKGFVGASTSSGDQPASGFQTTLWTEVVQAADGSSPFAAAALARLCQTYWRPVYAFVRRKGHSREAAEDLVQDFFSRFIEKKQVARADPERGRFRSFLLSSVENFLRDAHRHATRIKRGGATGPITFEVTQAEEEWPQAFADPLDPAVVFERLWATTVLDNVLRRLRTEYGETGRGVLFEVLHDHLWGEAEATPYAVLADRLGVTPVNLRVLSHRLRQRFRDLLREEIAQTVVRAGDIDLEIQHLLLAVSRP